MGNTCSVPVCQFVVSCKGLCRSHYERSRKNGGDPGVTPVKVIVKGRSCLFPGCGNKHFARGYCSGHDGQLKRGRPLTALGPYRRSTIRNDQGHKWCSSCSAWVNPSLFHRTGNTLDGLAAKCLNCRKGQKLIQNFNLDPDMYERILAHQGGGCAVCKGQSRSGDRLSVDHDHSCCPDKGRSCGSCIRGLLCEDCNRAIGLMRDDPNLMRSAAQYLDGS